MSAFNDILIDVQHMVIQGMSPTYISKVLDIPIDMVYDAIEVVTGDDVDSEGNQDNIFA